MESIINNINQVSSDFRGIKEKIVEHGVEVADGTPTSEYASKVDEVYEAGKAEMNRAWWDAQTNNGTRTSMLYGFSDVDFAYVGGFNPPYQLKPVGYSPFMFISAKRLGKITADEVDFSGCTTLQGMFNRCDVEEIEIIDAQNVTNFSTMFSENNWTKTIDKFILKNDGSQSFVQSSFYSAYQLANMGIEGTIGSDIWFTHCANLTRDSMLGKPATAAQITDGKNLFTVNGITYYGGIFGALKNFVKEGLGNTATITLHATPKSKLTYEEKLVVTDTLGWTIA